MKRYLVVLTAMLMMCLTACGGSPVNIYDITVDGVEFTVDYDQGTIISDGYVYNFYVSGDNITISYPDGSRFSRTEDAMGGNEQYYQTQLVDAMTLIDVIQTQLPKEPEQKSILPVFIFAAMGIVLVSSPTKVLSYGRKYNNSSITSSALNVFRLLGVVFIVIAAIMLLL